MMNNYKATAENKKNRSFDPGNLLLFLYLAVIVCCILLALVVPGKAAAQESAEGLRMEEVTRGELLVLGEHGQLTPSPLLSQKVDMMVSGITARVTVKQRFTNNSTNWIEAIYVFPLPHESAVDHLRLKIGERTIVGQIQEKEQARAVYEKAKRQGRKSSLLSQQRPNIFTTRVANIGPRETVSVEIEYQQTVGFDSGIFSLRFPMVVGPRYIPGMILDAENSPLENNSSPVTVGGKGWAQNTDQVPDASEITPRVDLSHKTTIPVEITVDLAAGIPLARVESLYHGIEKEQLRIGHYRLKLTGEVYADRDFVLEWQPRQQSDAQAALFAENRKEAQYMLLMLMPPERRLSEPLARELIFVLDISGSMAGPSIAQAKAATLLALRRLTPRDRFNIVVFNNRAKGLFPSAQVASGENVDKALSFVSGLNADGGTEMKPALLLALDGSSRHQRLRQVVFLTDGAVGNEDQLLSLISRRLGDSRLFTVGIGSAPNSYFMSRAARLGRGTHTHIGMGAEVQVRMTELFARLENPLISDLRLTINDKEVELESYPSPIPDLYLGEPLLLALRSDWKNRVLQVSGNISGQQWQTQVDTSSYGERSGIGALWARKKIRSLMESEALGADKEAIRSEVIATALAHHLVSKYTSLVAVDDLVSRPGEDDVKTAPVKTHLPRGWQPKAVFGGGSQTGTSADLQVLLGCLILLLAACISACRSAGVGR